jgi:hypothetical protein
MPRRNFFKLCQQIEIIFGENDWWLSQFEIVHAGRGVAFAAGNIARFENRQDPRRRDQCSHQTPRESFDSFVSGMTCRLLADGGHIGRQRSFGRPVMIRRDRQAIDRRRWQCLQNRRTRERGRALRSIRHEVPR